ncbi:hypothetical protein CDAR_192001 [Caerostris darwini]|uniref:Uncharacterized protein n=1 Tax=Caerostris darwini TaxID=1538125 RepID=A0AAV4NP53_9ARAC|nr:hypothetical protein CDAR_192001 [Caerostris darwini]
MEINKEQLFPSSQTSKPAEVLYRSLHQNCHENPYRTNKPQICSGVEALLTLQPVLNGVIVSKRRDPPPFELPPLTARATDCYSSLPWWLLISF